MPKTVQDIIDEVKVKRDTTNIEDEEIIEYINDLDAQFMESMFPVSSSTYIPLSTATSYDVSAYTSPELILKVYVDNQLILKKHIPNDDLSGWYINGNNIVLSSDIISGATGMTIMYRQKTTPHLLENAGTDNSLVIPASYHNLYVYYVLAELASKEADTASYANYKSDYNSLLAEALAVVTKNQLSPNYVIS